MSLVFLLSCLSACTGAMARGPVPLGRNLANGFILGIYEPQEEAKFSQVRRFAAAVGYKPNIVLNYSHWPQPFNSSFAKQVWAYGATPLIQIEPKDVVMSSIASGKWDAYLSQYARAVRNFGHTVIVSFAHEMNARWYSWGLGHVSPAVWVAAWRHVFRLFRDAGARNAIWLWTVNRLGPGIGGIRNWWPGSSYVTWIGIDGYYYFPKDTFASVFKSTIESVRSFTNKPIVLSEIAVGNFAGKAAKMPGLFTGIKRYHLRGLAWFDVPNPNPTTYHQNWREEGDPAAVRAFHKALAEIEKPADG